MSKISFSFFPRGSYEIKKNGVPVYWSLPSDGGLNKEMEFSEFVENYIKNPLITIFGNDCTLKGAHGSIAGILKKDHLTNKKENFIANQLLMFDFDDSLKLFYEDVINNIKQKGYNYVSFSSANHDEDSDFVRKKLIVPLENPIDTKEYESTIYSFLHDLGFTTINNEDDIDGFFNDSSLLQFSRVQFRPTVKSLEWKEKNFKVEFETNSKFYSNKNTKENE